MVIAQAYRAFANLPQRVHFTSEEMTNILSWGDLAAFNKILGVDEIHNSVLGQFETAQKYSENIKSKMKVITGQGNRVTVELDSNTRLLAMELDDLLTQMSGQLEKDRAETKQSLEELRQLTSKHLGLVVNLEFDSVPSPKA